MLMKKTAKNTYYDLLKKISKGDEKAFEKLYNIFWPELLNHILLKITDKQAAEDVLLEVFISLWNLRERILMIESIPAYLYSACRNRVFTYLRKHSVYTSQVELVDDLAVCCEDRIEDRLYYRYLLDLVEKEIEDLPEKCKEVFKLSRFSHLTNKEIADRLLISESTVENQINKAIKRLRASSDKVLLFLHLFF